MVHLVWVRLLLRFDLHGQAVTSDKCEAIDSVGNDMPVTLIHFLYKVQLAHAAAQSMSLCSLKIATASAQYLSCVSLPLLDTMKLDTAASRQSRM
jgi:hypothetical protein